MSNQHAHPAHADREQWLKTYYLVRAAVSAVWVAVALAVGQHQLPLATGLLIAYPLWDAAANYWDASRSGGLAHNHTQTINVVVSLITTLTAAYALFADVNWVFGVFGAWATLSGLLQLATAVRRRKAGAQWAMILSGAQSALVGGFFIAQAHMPIPESLKTLAGYATLGAVYFLVSAVWLFVKERRAKSASTGREERTETLSPRP
jgi:hypothetical protein